MKCPKCGEKFGDGPGRKALLDDAKTAQIVKEITAGIGTTTAAIRAGIDKATFFRWLEKGRAQKRGKYREFCDKIFRAEADRRAAHALRLVKASTGTDKKPGDWRAGAWLAERIDPEEFALKVNLQVEEVVTLGAERLRQEFSGEPEILERAIRALAGRSVLAASGAARAEEEASGGGAAPPAVAPPAAPDPV